MSEQTLFGQSEYDKLYENAKEKSMRNLVDPDEPIIVCRLDELNENLGGDYGRVNIVNDIIYLHPESEVHFSTRISIGDDINSSLPTSIRNSFNHFSSRVPVCNRYACGSLQYKYPDFNFYKCDSIKNMVLAGEIIFRNETDEQIMLESAHYLTEYTPVRLVMIVQLPRHKRDGFNIRLILIQRASEFDEEKRKLLKLDLKNGVTKWKDCVKVDSPIDLTNKRMYSSVFNVKLLDLIEYTSADFEREQPIEFEIPGSVFDHPEPILIKIQFSTIQFIKTEWDEFMNLSLRSDKVKK